MKTFSIILISLALILTACSALSKPADPTPGATFSGPIEMPEYAKSAELSFKVSNDGATIEEITFVLNEIKCDGMSGGKMTSTNSVNIPVTNGKIEDPGSLYELKGTFSSPTEASGTMKVVIRVFGKTQCDLGPFTWSAQVK